MNRRGINRIVFASLIILAVPSLAMASAPSAVLDVTRHVSYDDLNIGSEAGAKVLYARLQRASERACDVRSLTALGSIDRFVHTRACFDDTLAAAVRRIDSPALAKIHEG